MQLILGMGRTGLSVARFFAKKNLPFIIADDQKKPSLLADCQACSPVKFYGGQTNIPLENISQAIISPGIPDKHWLIKQLKQKNIPLKSDIDLFAQHAKAPIVAVTGSNGKSTVVHLLTKMANDAGMCATMGGNVGIPALEILSEQTQLYVLELSSYQLDYINHINLNTAVVLNISPDHLDRYHHFDDYVASKLSIYKHTKQPIVPNNQAHIPLKANQISYGLELPRQKDQFGTVVCHHQRYLLQGETVLMSADEMSLLGLHNVHNTLAALSLGFQIGLDVKTMVKTIKQFDAIDHRLQWVACYHRIDYYNDSKSTNVCASLVALEAIAQKHPSAKLVLLMGGLAKKEDYQPLAKLASQLCHQIIIFGQDQTLLAPLFAQRKTSCVNSLEIAIKTAQSMINQGVILLSPACASFDQFTDFTHRGNAFVKAIE